MRNVVTGWSACILGLSVLAAPAAAQTAGGETAPAQAPPPAASTPAAPGPPAADTPTDGPTVPGVKAKLRAGVAYAPDQAPQPVKQAIWAANRLQGLPYRYGGGHASTQDTGYDCSGTVSFALYHAGLLDEPLDSSSLLEWGEDGPGQWMTVYTNPGHAYAVIAGLRLDTSAANDPTGAKGPRWRRRVRAGDGFTARHFPGL